jgi:nitrite reductase/ring-hydroxylating ferredoxin subunit/uncharacterized membrane protein
MRSRANVKGHPIHPALVMFPLAGLIGAFVFDVLGCLTGRPALWTTGGYLTLAGIGTALVAAVPGFIDYLAVVPPRSSGKRRATKHMIVNLSAVTLFAVAFAVRGGPAEQPAAIVLVLEGLGVALVSVGGWMGGTLVSRNQISVDHRYAHAGKWREIRVDPARGDPLVVAQSNELQVNQMMLVHVGDRRVVVGRTAQGYVAFDDHCTHRGASLADGVMICGTVQCPWHGSQFDASDGSVKAGPATRKIAAYAVEARDGKVLLRL